MMPVAWAPLPHTPTWAPPGPHALPTFRRGTGFTRKRTATTQMGMLCAPVHWVLGHYYWGLHWLLSTRNRPQGLVAWPWGSLRTDMCSEWSQTRRDLWVSSHSRRIVWCRSNEVGGCICSGPPQDLADTGTTNPRLEWLHHHGWIRSLLQLVLRFLIVHGVQPKN